MLHIYKDANEVSHQLAEWITSLIESTLKQQDGFTWVLTGGNSPKQLYQLLATSPYRERIQWEKLHFFWGDERAVPFEDSRNNARMTFEALLNKVPVKQEQIHIMQTDIAPDASAFAYEKILHTYFPSGNQTFDLVLNGMGDDAHTLSLFPGSPAIKEQEAWVTSFWLQEQDMYRITLTAPVVNLAKKVVFLTFGANKANALQHVIEGPSNVELYPSQLIQPQSGELHWFIDEAAVATLTKK